MMRIVMAALLCLIMAGCAAKAPVDTGRLKGPAGWLMAKPCALPKYPKANGDPVVRASYDTDTRRCAARRGDQVRGLQAYARTVTKRR